MITLSNFSKSFGGRDLFKDVNLSFSPGHRFAITGPNGAGKTTLMKMIMKEIEPTTGTVALPKKVGMLRQNIESFQEEEVVQVVIRGNQRLWEALRERDALYEEPEITEEIGMRLGDLEAIVGEENGYAAEAEAEVLLTGMKIPSRYFRQKVKTIPTDMQFKVLLCQALFGNPEALLLDEPTNHLDLEAIGWLETFLHAYSGTLIVTSHDRHFLNSIATDVADIDYETIILYPGNYDDMVLSKLTNRRLAEAEVKSKKEKIEQLQKFVSRFGAGTRASQVKSRKNEIERLQPEELKQSNIQRPYIRFLLSDKNAGKLPLKVEHLCKSYSPDALVIQNLSFEIHKGDKVAVIGPNGCGKTTLLKLLSQRLLPDSGTIQQGNQVLLSYFPQNHSEIVNKAEDASAFEWLKAQFNGIQDQDVRSAMGKMLFGGDDAFKPISKLSGGETGRLILAHMLLSQHNLLVLDEPDNHLDLEAVSELGKALSEYKGTVILASHNRDLLSQVATKVLYFEKNKFSLYLGSFQEYFDSKAAK